MESHHCSVGSINNLYFRLIKSFYSITSFLLIQQDENKYLCNLKDI